MKTIKLPYTTTTDLLPYIKQYNIIVRSAYNKLLKGFSEKEIYAYCKTLNNISTLNSQLLKYGIGDAIEIHNRYKDKVIVFGGKNNFIKRCKNKITKEEYQFNKLRPLYIQGDTTRKGNRLFKLDIINNNKLIFKPYKNIYIELNLPKLRKNYIKDLYKLEELNNVKCGEQGYKYCVKFDLNYIYISFEEFKEDKCKLKEDRYLGIDLNPEHIGVSVLEGEKILHTQQYSFTQLFDKILNSKLSSNDPKMKYYHNKLEFESFNVSKDIVKLAKHYGCKYVFIEELSFKNKTSSKTINRICKNLWKKTIFIENLKKRCNIYNIKLHEINPCYSSLIGNLQYDYTDPVNASLEIARRGYQCRINKKNSFYPPLSKEFVKHQWKEMVTEDVKEWKELFLKLKNLKLKYRVSLNEVKHEFKVFKQNSYKSKTIKYVFCK